MNSRSRIFLFALLLGMVSLAAISSLTIPSVKASLGAGSLRLDLVDVTDTSAAIRIAMDDISYSKIAVKGFSLELVADNGRCTLLYRQLTPSKRPSTGRLDLGMNGPCEFVRRASANHEPLYYTYQRREKRRSVLLVSGGLPHSRARDDLMPNGCGTEVAKVRVFADRVEVVPSNTPPHQYGSKFEDPAVCPSQSMDEIFFAT